MKEKKQSKKQKENTTIKKAPELKIYEFSFGYIDKNDNIRHREGFRLSAYSHDEAMEMLKQFAINNGMFIYAPMSQIVRKNKTNSVMLSEDYYKKELEVLEKGKRK